MSMNSHDHYVKVLTNSPNIPVELIQFCNVRATYCLNEDIFLEYVLDAELQPSFRDWIGIYPRGWMNFHQYVTFEWVTIRPCELSLQRNVLFHWRHHSQVVQTDREYQFLYINRQLEILGHSLFFRFVETGERKNICTVSSERALTSSISFCADYLSNRVQEETCGFIVSTRPCESVMKVMDGQQMNSQSMTSSAELIHNLEDRIHDLEKNLEECEVVQKHLKLVARQSELKMLAYQKFINDLCLALSQKGVVQVIDEKGNEMLVKQVPNTETQTDVTEKHPQQNAAQKSYKDLGLKSGVDSQVQVIYELLSCPDSTSKMESVKQMVQSLITAVPCRQEVVSASGTCEDADQS